MRKSNFALRLQPSLLEELRIAAAADETTINQYINIAVAEKLAVLRNSQGYFASRAKRGDPQSALKLLDKIGNDNAPQPGDRIKKRRHKT